MGKYVSRSRDLKKYLKTGGSLRILAVENQNQVDYSMPFRCMEYDTLEYRQQLKELHKKNEKDKDYATVAERLCKVKKSDRLYPVYTVCLYHGEALWDGPRSLKDMMEFGKSDSMEKYFAEYPMRLYCVNEESDFSMFRTELKELFKVMQYRKDKKGLQKLFTENKEYQHLNEETVEAIAIVLNEPEIWRNREMYKSVLGEEEEEYNMCQAMTEWREEERSAGRAEGRAEGKAESVLELLEELGVVPENIKYKIIREADLATLSKWNKLLIKVDSVEAFISKM